MFDWVVRIDTEAVPVRQAVGIVLRNAGAEFSGLGDFWVGPEWDEVKRAQPHNDVDVISIGSDAVDDLTKNSRAVFERAAVPPRPGMGAQKFMQQVAVAMLDIDEVQLEIRGESCSPYVAANQLFDLVIRPYLTVIGDLEFGIQNRVSIGHARLEFVFFVWPTKTPRVRELNTDYEVIGRTIALEVRRLQSLDQPRDTGLIVSRNDQLVGVRPAVGPNRHGLTAEN